MVVLVSIFFFVVVFVSVNRAFLTPITKRSFTTIAEKRKLKKLDAPNLTFNSFDSKIMLILLLSITAFRSLRRRGISFCIFTGKIFE